jgi:three-Cys-motif partner protein
MRFSSDRYSKKHLCKGSALIPLFAAGRFPFSEYYFFDEDKAKTAILDKRIDRVQKEKEIATSALIHRPEALSFGESSEKLFGKTGALKKTPLSLVIIDPEGHTETPWNHVMTVLLNGKLDLIMTFMTSGLIRSIGKARKDLSGSYARTLDGFFGDRGWQNLETADSVLDYYCGKIRSLGYHVRTMSVNEKGKRRIYDIIFASKNRAVIDRIFSDLQKKMEKVTPELLASGIGVNQNEFADLTQFLNQGEPQ